MYHRQTDKLTHTHICMPNVSVYRVEKPPALCDNKSCLFSFRKHSNNIIFILHPYLTRVTFVIITLFIMNSNCRSDSLWTNTCTIVSILHMIGCCLLVGSLFSGYLLLLEEINRTCVLFTDRRYPTLLRVPLLFEAGILFLTFYYKTLILQWLVVLRLLFVFTSHPQTFKMPYVKSL